MIPNMNTDNTPNRLPANDRRAQILDEALRCAEVYGYTNITRQMVADRLGLAPGLVSHYFGTMDDLRRDVMRHAIKRENLRVVAQGVIAGHPVAMRAPRDLKSRALAALAPKARP
jgi:AcrR family transcriptional regulator